MLELRKTYIIIYHAFVWLTILITFDYFSLNITHFNIAFFILKQLIVT